MILSLLLAALAQQPGRLVVLVVVDQLRYDDVLRLSPELGPEGFAGLGTPSPLRYDTAVTETAADHAVLSTGAYADLNGVVGNRFWRDGALREAVEDAACPVWGKRPGRSAAALLVPTVGDAYKLNREGAGRVVSIAVKDRSALFLGGTSADIAVWWETKTGEMSSSSCYAPSPPDWVPRRAGEPYKDWVWSMSHPEAIARLTPEPSVPGAQPNDGIGNVFPHRLGQGSLDERLFHAIRMGPPGTTIALRTARNAAAALKLGELPGKTDLLLVALSAVDGVGHQFGTLARERLDAILRIHDELGAFLGELRSRLGPRLSVVLTADHGLTPMATDARRLRVGLGGTIDVDEVLARVGRALDEVAGPRPGGWVAGIQGSVLSLKPPVPQKALDAAVEVLRREPGFWRVVTAADVDRAEPFIRHAWYPGRSGQVLLVPRPLWTLKKRDDGAEHGSPWNDDALVPLMLRAPGARLRKEPIFRATQVAPTVAELLGTAPPAAAFDVSAIEQQ